MCVCVFFKGSVIQSHLLLHLMTFVEHSTTIPHMVCECKEETGYVLRVETKKDN